MGGRSATWGQHLTTCNICTEREEYYAMAGRLQRKVAVITGASRGLGQYCAVGYAAEGAKVVIAARTQEESNPQLPGTIFETARLCEQAGGEAFPVVCNVGDVESIDTMTKQVLEKYGQI